MPSASPLASTEYGAAEAATLVFLHGFAGNQSTWRLWVDDLSRDYHLLTVDLKGFGNASKPRDRKYSPGDHAQLVWEFLDERDLRDVTLVGHSLGGGVALLVALRQMDVGVSRVTRLAIISGPAYPQALPPFVSLARLPLLGSVALRLVPPRRIIAAALRSIVFDPRSITDLQIDNYAAPISAKGGRYGLLQAARQLVPPDLDTLVARYPDIDLPVLLLWGRNDGVIPLEVAHRLHETLPNARLDVLERCGHLLPEEQPQAGISALRSFLEPV